jgi:hypothetical protein
MFEERIKCLMNMNCSTRELLIKEVAKEQVIKSEEVRDKALKSLRQELTS